jgi:hypothetical protein
MKTPASTALETPMTTTPLTDQQLALHSTIVAAAQSVQLRLGPNALRMAATGPIRLSGGECYQVADAVLAVVRPELDRLAAELGRVRAELTTAKADRETARAAWRRVKAGITASADLLDEPFTNAPAQSPWTRLKPAMHLLDDALKPTPPAAAVPSA